jgi:magnesium chelatase family protein
MDRVDIYIEVPAVDVEKLSKYDVIENTKAGRQRVINARLIQRQRYQGRILTNSEMANDDIKQFCAISEEGMNLLKMAISSFNLSARGYHRVLKLSRTIADLADSENILTEHVAEALQYRARDETH